MKKDFENLINLPLLIKRKLFGLRDFEAAYIIARLVRKKKKILVVGCTWGRDYHFLSSFGKEVINFDLGIQEVPNLVVGIFQIKLLLKMENLMLL
jgi:hypothetical protein